MTGFVNASPLAERLHTLGRQRAETLYALAVTHANAGMTAAAAGYGAECILELDRLGTDTQEECATHAATLDGVVMPELLHIGVVQSNLGHLGVSVDIL